MEMPHFCTLVDAVFRHTSFVGDGRLLRAAVLDEILHWCLSDDIIYFSFTHSIIFA